MEKLTKFFNWKEYFQSQKVSESIHENSSLLFYSKHLFRVIYYLAIGSTIIFQSIESIHCESDHSDISSDYIKKMCILPYYGSHGIHPGIQESSFLASTEYKILFKHEYYIWIYGILLIMSFIVNIPLQLFQNGIQSDKHQEIIDCCELINKKSPKKLKQILVETIKLQKLFLDFHGSKQFIFHYLLMVIFSMITIGLQFWLLDYIFYGFYWKLGWELFINGKLEILQFLFPSISTCHFRKYGTSGSSEMIDSICSLNYNLFNRYIFTFIWFAFTLNLIYLTFELIKVMLMIMKIRLWKMDSINQKSTKLMKTFRLIPIVENINQYDNDAIEIISNEFYCWPLIMLKLTPLNYERIEMKLEQFKTKLEIMAKKKLYKPYIEIWNRKLYGRDNQ
ncbi:hypothetical protein BLOT_011421 [Blomia tropicalis]|nr:hypothetical protein BLOT_011421 [Blomia tropicalis]